MFKKIFAVVRNHLVQPILCMSSTHQQYRSSVVPFRIVVSRDLELTRRLRDPH